VSEKLAKLYLYQMLKGLVFIHEMRFVHCNLSMEAIRVTQTGKIKIGDFEQSNMITLAGECNSSTAE